MKRISILLISLLLMGCFSVTYVQSLKEVDQKMRDPICWDIYFKDSANTYLISRCDLTLDQVIQINCIESMKVIQKTPYIVSPKNSAYGSRAQNGETIIVDSQSISNGSSGVCKNFIGYDYQVKKPGGVDLYLIYMHLSKKDNTFVVDRNAKMFEWENLKNSKK
jgi:hypothetical protein